MAKLRYDLVAQAITSLQRYMDTCAQEDNTLALVWDAADSVDQLKALEHGVRQRHAAGKPAECDTLSVLAEVEGKIEDMQALTAFLTDFMKTYHNEIQMLRKISASTYEMSNVITQLKAIERNLNLVRGRVQLA